MNKIAGAILSAGLLAMLTGFAAHMLYHPKELAEPAFVIAAGEPKTETAQAEAPAGPEPILALLASASADDGEKLSKKCTACHSFTSGGPNKVGPNLWNIVGGKPASVDGYSYSSAMKAMEMEWGYEELNQFLYKPKDFVKGTKMSFAGFKKASDRAAMVAYLRSLSDNPKPLP